MSTEEVHSIVRGRVQQVLFRDFVRQKALAFGIVGTVENLDDGTVRVIAQGPRYALEKLIECLHQGTSLSRVERVDVEWREPVGQFESFEIVY